MILYFELTAEETSVASPLSHLSKTLATALNNQDHIEEELEALEEVDSNASPIAVNAESNIAIIYKYQHIYWMGSSSVYTYCALDIGSNRGR